MSANPELRRNLWLEATPVRLLLVPAILAGVFYVAYASDGRRLGAAVATVALVAFGGLTSLWGAHLASESVLAELRGRTWDWQRMSALRPWTLAWGKLAGATAIPWYGGALCLAAFAAAEPPPGMRKGWVAALLVLAGLLSQAATLFAALHGAGRERVASRAQSSAYLAFALLGVYPLVSLGLSSQTIRWYHLEVPAVRFAVATLAAFAAFAVAGVWVQARHELRVRTPPGLWPAFVLFSACWAGGLGAGEARRGPAGGALLLAFGSAVALTWGTALVERKDPVRLRRLARAVREGRWRRAAEELPPWLLALPFVVAAWAALLAAPGLVVETDRGVVRLTATAVVLFLCRDLALFLFLGLGARPRRAELFAIVLLLAGYVLVPLVLSAVGAKELAALFYPSPDYGAWSVAGGLLQAAVVAALLALRWRLLERTIAAATASAPPG